MEIIKAGYEILIMEHGNGSPYYYGDEAKKDCTVTVKFTCDLATSHIFVRQSSPDDLPDETDVDAINLKFIKPCYLDPCSTAFTEWATAMWHAERAYKNMVIAGCKPEEARAVLPNSYATSVIVTATLRSWRHILKLRTANTSPPSMRELTRPLLADLQAILPEVFDDVIY